MLTEANVQYLRDKFSMYTNPDNEGLKSIALVGGMPTVEYLQKLFLTELSEDELQELKTEGSGLVPSDEILLGETLKTLQKLGYKVTADFDVTIININEEFGGLDYMELDDSQQFDISIFCFISRTKKEEERVKNESNNGLKGSAHETRDKHAWLRASIERGSKVIATHGAPGNEVTAKDFKGGWLKKNWSPFKLRHSESMEQRPGDLLRQQDAVFEVMVHNGYQ